MTIETLHRIDRPFAEGTIEVYGEPDMAWYEWRIIQRGEVLEDTGKHGAYGMQYGSAGIALRDALNYDEPPLPQPAQEAAYAVYVRGVVVATADDRPAAEAAFSSAWGAFIEALVGAGWDRTAAEDEAEIVMSLGIRDADG